MELQAKPHFFKRQEAKEYILLGEIDGAAETEQRSQWTR